MNYKGFKVEVDPKDLDKKNIVYYWLIKLNNNQQASYVGISTRTLQERTKEHLRKVKNPLEKYPCFEIRQIIMTDNQLYQFITGNECQNNPCNWHDN